MNRPTRSVALLTAVLVTLCFSCPPTATAAKKNSNRKKSRRIALPVLDKGADVFAGVEGPFHATYASESLSAAVAADGSIWVLPTTSQEGTGLIRPIRLTLECTYVRDEDRKRRRSRKVTSFPSPPEPSRNPNAVAIQRLHTDGVKSTVTITFEGNTVSADLSFEDPPGLEPASHFLCVARIPATLEFGPGEEVTEKQLEVLLDGFRLEAKGKKVKYTGTKGPGREFKSATIETHWPGRKIDVSFRKEGGFFHYGTQPLYNGYRLQERTRDGKGDGRVRVTVK